VIIEYRKEIDGSDFTMKRSEVGIIKRKELKESITGEERVTAGFIGAGLFATGTILPTLKKMKNIRLKGLATATGYKGHHVSKKFGFEYFTTDYKEILNDKDINLVFIMTRHGSHAHFICEALRARKNIFTEKPLCLNKTQLQKIVNEYNNIRENKNFQPVLMVGFNRRYSILSKWIKDKFSHIKEPLSIHIRCNAGYIPPDHWIFDPEDGGGRIIGEVCHFLDLIQFFTDSYPESVYAEYIDSSAYKASDNVSINIKMKNGSIGSILYVASGDKRFPRERVEIFVGGAVGVIENFKSAYFVSGGRKKTKRIWFGIDRGYKGEMESLILAIKSGENQFSLDSYWFTTKATFAIEKSLREGIPIRIE